MSAEPLDGFPPFFVKGPPTWKVDPLYDEMTWPHTYKPNQRCRVTRVDCMKDTTRNSVEHEFSQFTIEYTVNPAVPASPPRHYTVIIEVHRSGSGGGSCNSGSSSPNPISGSVELPSSNSVPAKDEIVILGQSADRTSIRYPNSKSMCHLTFESPEGPTAVDLVALLSTISNFRPNYFMKGGVEQAHCYWYTGVVWAALRAIYPRHTTSDISTNHKGKGKHSTTSFFRADDKVIAEQVKEIQTRFLDRKNEMSVMAKKKAEAARDKDSQELMSKLEVSEANKAKAEEKASQERMRREAEGTEKDEKAQELRSKLEVSEANKAKAEAGRAKAEEKASQERERASQERERASQERVEREALQQESNAKSAKIDILTAKLKLAAQADRSMPN